VLVEGREVEADLEAARSEWGSRLGEDAWLRLSTYIRLLHRWSAQVNLVSQDDRAVLATKHLRTAVDAATLAQAVPHRTILDIGSGAGIPGVPLAICLPESRVYLVESRRRRAHFLREIIRRLDLIGVKVVPARAEAWSGPGGGGVDLVTARAVAPVPQLLALATPHLAPWGGLLTTLPSGSHPPGSRHPEVRWPERTDPLRPIWGLFYPGKGSSAHLP
jgi:16S rRNA (guanine527-N7)-methyltransferase